MHRQNWTVFAILSFMSSELEVLLFCLFLMHQYISFSVSENAHCFLIIIPTCGQVTRMVWSSLWSLPLSLSKNGRIESFTQDFRPWPIEKCQVYCFVLLCFTFCPLKQDTRQNKKALTMKRTFLFSIHYYQQLLILPFHNALGWA